MADFMEAAVIAGSQFLDEGVEEGAEAVEQRRPTIMGLDTSQVADGAVAVTGIGLPFLVDVGDDARTASWVVGTGRLASLVSDLVGSVTGGGGAQVVQRTATPTQTASTGGGGGGSQVQFSGS